jgi:hypothetical protein
LAYPDPTRRHRRSAIRQQILRSRLLIAAAERAGFCATAVNATWGNCGRLLSGGVKSDRIGLGIGKGEQPWSSMLAWTYH